MLAEISLFGKLICTIPISAIIVVIVFPFAYLNTNTKYAFKFHETLTKKEILKRCNIKMDIIIFVYVAWNIGIILLCFFMALTKTKISFDNPWFLMILPFFVITLVIAIGTIIAGRRIIKKIILTNDAIENNKFFVYTDTIVDKIDKFGSGSYGKYSYYFCFKILNEKLNKRIEVPRMEYIKSEIGDEYYVVYIVTTKKIYIYKKDYYDLDYDVQSNYVENPNFEYYLNNNSYK